MISTSLELFQVHVLPNEPSVGAAIQTDYVLGRLNAMDFMNYERERDPRFICNIYWYINLISFPR